MAFRAKTITAHNSFFVCVSCFVFILNRCIMMSIIAVHLTLKMKRMDGEIKESKGNTFLFS